MKNYFLICNPGSRNFRSVKTIQIYKKLLQQKGISFACAYTKKKYDATFFARNAIEQDFDVIVAVGGDGTISEVIKGFFDEKGNAAEKKFGVLYSGTSPDFCKFHGIPFVPDAAVETLLSETVNKIDIGCIKMKDYRKKEATYYFGSSVNIGIGAEVAKKANRYRKYLGDFFGTFFATIDSIIRYKPRGIYVFIDNHITTSIPEVLNVTIGKNPYLASGIKLNVPISPSDGNLYLFSVNRINKLSFFFQIPSIYKGTIVENKKFILKSISKIEVTPQSGEQEVEFDGDAAGFCPIKVGIKTKAITLIGGSI